MTFSYNAVWEDTARLLRAHGALLTAIAGVFIFLPNLLLERFLPPPVHGSESMEIYARLFLDYFRHNSLWIAGVSFVVMMGSLAMLRLVFAAKATVGAALVAALMLLPAYSLLIAIECVILALGLFLLIVPGLYLAGRLAPVGAVMVAEDRRNSIDALKRSFALTRGRGWAVFGLVFIVYLTGMIIAKVIEYLLGSLFILLAGQDLGKLLIVVVTAAVGAVFLTVMTMLYAAIYRALAAAEKAGPDLKKAD
jgi:hypothetical protein